MERRVALFSASKIHVSLITSEQRLCNFNEFILNRLLKRCASLVLGIHVNPLGEHSLDECRMSAANGLKQNLVVEFRAMVEKNFGSSSFAPVSGKV
jgi:hypothetical protein